MPLRLEYVHLDCHKTDGSLIPQCIADKATSNLAGFLCVGYTPVCSEGFFDTLCIILVLMMGFRLVVFDGIPPKYVVHCFPISDFALSENSKSGAPTFQINSINVAPI
jgi:hypothetical protein